MVDPNQVQLLPKVIEGLEKLKLLGFKFGIITNQSVIGRGMATRLEVDQVNLRVLSLLESENISISFVKVCPHISADLCQCRKPLPKLGIEAKEEFQIDMSGSFMIGDADSDISFGQNIGCQTIQIVESAFQATIANYATIDLLSAAEYIGSQMKRA